MMMKAAVVHGPGDIRYEDVPKPRIEPHEVLVRVRATGVCGSDLPRVLGTSARYYPIILGHEFSGEVVEVGKDTARIKVGDPVVGAPLLPCMVCVDCAKGDYDNCRHYSFIGSRLPGSWAEYVKLPEKNLWKLSEGISFEQGALFEPTTVALHGLSVMGFHGGTDVGILGVGTIGLLTLQCAKLLGARRIFAFDLDPSRLAIAKKYGADFCFNTTDKDFHQEVMELTKGRGLPMILETAGVEFTEKLSLELAANKGNVMFIGTPTKPLQIAPQEFELLNRKELTLRGSWMSYSAPFPGSEWELADYYFSKGLIKYEELINRIVPLSDVVQVFADLAQPGKVKGKVLFRG